MKVARKVFFGLVVGAMVFVSGVSFAETATSAPVVTPAAATNEVSAAKQVRHDARIKLLQDSAAALQSTNPDLAMKLTDIVNGASKEKTEASRLSKDSAEWQAKRDARIQLYKDAATALQTTNPDLAKGLMDMTVPKQKTEMQKVTE
jgi:LAS superfamily LD-carboxypeptidase LdcB